MSIEERSSIVEKELAEVKERLTAERPERPWYEGMIGSMKDFPEFGEVARLGREIRKSDSND